MVTFSGTPERTPVVIGVGQLRSNPGRTVEGAREPLTLLLEAARLAEADSGIAGLLERSDTVLAVQVSSWAYDDLATLVATRLGAAPRTAAGTTVSGVWPVRLLARACDAIAAGDSSVALVVGGEAQASQSALGRAGLDAGADAGWLLAPGGPPHFDPEQLGTPSMIAAGLLLPARVYPLVDNALQAELGLTPAENAAWSAQIYSDASAVAAGNPAAWAPVARTPADIGTVTAANRMVCEPYPISEVANPIVDQAAALIVTSLAVARAAGIPDARLVFPCAAAGVDDDPDLLARATLAGSAALTRCLASTLERAGVTAAELEAVDVYSCFPVVPKLAGIALGLPRETVLTVTGGHSAFGGPLCSYTLHSLVAAVELLRRAPGTALVHANGGYLTAQHAVVLGTEPPADGWVAHPVEKLTAAGPTVVAAADIATDAGVALTVESATVEHARGGGAETAYVVGRLPDGRRVAGTTADPAAAQGFSLAALPPGRTTYVGLPARLTLRGGAPAFEPA